MGNYYTFDIIKCSDGSYKFIDFHGTNGAGLTLIESVYGNNDRIKRFVQILDGMAKGKIIVYKDGFNFAGLTFIPEENDFTRNLAY